MAFDVTDADRYEQAHLAVFDPRIALVGQVAYAVVLAIVYVIYRPVTPDADMRIWLTMVLVVLGVIAAFDLAFVIRRPDPAELMRFWRKVDKRVPAAFDLLAVGILFLLFPYATEELRSLSVAFFVGYVPLQMISDPENSSGTQFSIVMVLGAFAVSLALHGTSVYLAMSGLVVIYAAVLFLSSAVLRRGVIRAMIDRQISDERTRELQLTLTDLQAERDAKTRFIATAAHDLSQPVLAARLLANQIGQSGLSDRQKATVDTLETALDSINTMSSHMLHSLRLQADAVRPTQVPVTVGEIVTAVAGAFAGVARDEGIRLRVVHSSVPIVTDRVLLERALGNLVLNAILHSGGSRVLVGVRRRSGGRLRFCVLDDGRGIDAADHDGLFGDFYRGAPRPDKATGGFGLGLSSVRRLARLLGGEADFARQTRRGAVFWIEVPDQTGGRKA